MQYYALWYQLDSEQRFLLWVTDLDSDAKDHVLVDSSDFLLSFSDLSALVDYAKRHKIDLVDQKSPTLHNLDIISKWLDHPVPTEVDCIEMLNAWNLFLDIWQSVSNNRDTFRAFAEPNRDVYDKLFYGNNLPVINTSGQEYIPSWDADEIKVLCGVMSSGLAMLRSNLAQ